MEDSPQICLQCRRRVHPGPCFPQQMQSLPNSAQPDNSRWSEETARLYPVERSAWEALVLAADMIRVSPDKSALILGGLEDKIKGLAGRT